MKERLHSNNPDDSKLVLSDIQSRICGIEKVIADAVRGTTSKQGSSKVMKANCQDKNKFVSGHNDPISIPSYTVGELKKEVVEARFFLHDKLQRDVISSGILEGHSSDRSDSYFEDESLGSIDENSIAVKFLASLDLEQGEPRNNVVTLASEHATVQATGFGESTSAAVYALKKMLCEIGQKALTGGWFVSEEAVLLAHHNGSCSAGNATESGFCSWDYYTRDIQAFCMEDTTNSSPLPCSSMMPLGSLSNAGLRRSNSCATSTVEQQQWWYKSCALSYSLLLPALCNGEVEERRLAGTEAISLWDVNSRNPQSLLSVASAGKRIYSLNSEFIRDGGQDPSD
ncbi:hypothetical protein ZIOFF_029923 [Zingiber officinale]|uniref:At4g14310 8-bladed propeller domain-containing protein n=1 Tax=Zingiber officinale TaxID=94328 RepID=A0A8J5H8Q1_ZINOF|nr:hypothetical protein ZIOFF_029923 [Zingiber officinale]